MGKTTKIIMDNIDTLLKDDKKRKVVLLIGFLLILIIFISSIIPDDNKNKKEDTNTKNSQNSSLKDYEKDIESEVLDLVRHIDGVGRVKVMVTLESSEEFLYQFDSKTQSTEKTNDKQEQVVIVDDENGNKKALVKTKKLPKIMGIVIVCDGAENIDVEYRIVNALTTAFDISSANVSVVLHSKTDN